MDNNLSLYLGKMESILFGSRPTLKSQSCKGTAVEPKYFTILGCSVRTCPYGASMGSSLIQKANASFKL